MPESGADFDGMLRAAYQKREAAMDAMEHINNALDNYRITAPVPGFEPIAREEMVNTLRKHTQAFSLAFRGSIQLIMEAAGTHPEALPKEQRESLLALIADYEGLPPRLEKTQRNLKRKVAELRSGGAPADLPDVLEGYAGLLQRCAGFLSIGEYSIQTLEATFKDAEV